MAQKSSIEWVADFHEDGTVTQGYTVNPIRFRPHGSDRLTTMCQKISPGCANCYAAGIVQRFWPKDADVPFPGYTAQGVTSGEFVEDIKQLESILKIKKATKCFWGDMTDIFQESIPDFAIDYCFAVCALTPHITHMFLTKRPERMIQYIQSENLYERILIKANLFRAKRPHLMSIPISDPHKFPLRNVMLGTSAENQKYFDERVSPMYKLQSLKWKTFLSLEPLIGPIDVEYPKTVYPDGPPMCCDGYECGCQGKPVDPPMIYSFDLAIVGGESGLKARPMQSNWAGDIQQACARWKVPFFFKQRGMWVDVGDEEFGNLPTGRVGYFRSDGSEWTAEELKTATEDSDVCTMKRVGRKRAGKKLFGRIHHEFPEINDKTL